ncbi:MAG: hypothetical protein J0H67_11990 [Rhodospirillales bacterium]|nr:hypothetical protein [Rhodospirillales bacterium]
MKRHSLFKYYDDRKWAEAFLDGDLLFRSLAYYRDLEDNMVREDQKEGTSVFRPEGGLVVTNHTQGTTMTLEDCSFESTAAQQDIFVFCMSRSRADEVGRAFGASVCVEIHDIATLCARVTAALPSDARLPQMAGRSGQIGHRVTYYPAEEGGQPRWALPDLIAISKLEAYKWQDEFRLVFSLTGALDFENVTTRLVHKAHPRDAARPLEHKTDLVKAGTLHDIARIRELAGPDTGESPGLRGKPGA